MRVPEQSPLASEVLSGSMNRNFTDAEITVKCPRCATPVTLDAAEVALTHEGSEYYCPNDGRPATLLLRVERTKRGGRVISAPHGYGLAVKPS